MRRKSLLLTHKQLLSRSVSDFTQTDSRSQYEDEIIEQMCRVFCCSFSFPPDRIVCTETGVVPHGNSISGYDSYRNPSARWCSFTRNTLSRPPYRKGTEQNWVQRETLTTDGSGGDSGTAVVLRQDRVTTTATTTIHLRWLTWQATPRVGLSVLVLAGSGMGQLRRIVGVGPDNGTVALDGPLDDWVATNSSIVAVIASYGSKIFAGNSFNWTEVVQWYLRPRNVYTS